MPVQQGQSSLHLHHHRFRRGSRLPRRGLRIKGRLSALRLGEIDQQRPGGLGGSRRVSSPVQPVTVVVVPVEEVAGSIAVDADVGVEAQDDLTRPDGGGGGFGEVRHERLEAGLGPEGVGEGWVVDLEAVVDAGGVAALGGGGGGGEGEGGEEGGVGLAQGGGEEVGDQEDLGREEGGDAEGGGGEEGC